MRARCLAAALMWIAFGVVNTAAAQEQQKIEEVRVTASAANIRVNAGTTYRVIVVAPRGTLFSVLAKEGEWYRVRIPPGLGKQVPEGFVHQSTVVVSALVAAVSNLPDERPDPEEAVPAAPTPIPTLAPRADSRLPSIRFYSVKGGLSISSAKFMDLHLLDWKRASRTGFAIGGAMVVPFGEAFWLQPEVILAQKGLTFQHADDMPFGPVIAHELDLVLTYLEIPLLARLNMRTESALEPYIIGGPTVSLKVGGDWRWKSTYEGDSESGSGPADEVDSADLGLLLGLGVERNKWLIEMRYNIGLVDASSEVLMSLQNRAFTLLLGYRP
jgi:hypothetical protein